MNGTKLGALYSKLESGNTTLSDKELADLQKGLQFLVDFYSQTGTLMLDSYYTIRLRTVESYIRNRKSTPSWRTYEDD